MRTAVIGSGNMGRHHVKSYSEIGSELVGIADIDIKRAKGLASEWGTRAYKDYHDLLKKEKPEAVSLAVPTALHAKIGTELLEKGIGLLIEKPVANTLEEAHSLAQAAEKTGTPLMVGHIERFNPAVQKMKGLLEGKKVIAMSAMRVGPHPPKVIKTGVIKDMGIHELDIIPYLCGEPIRTVYAKTRRVFTEEHDDSGHVFITTENISGTVLTNWITPRKIRNLYVTLEDRFLYLNYITQNIYAYKKEVENDVFTLDTEAGLAEKIVVKREEPLKRELCAFLDYCSGGENPCTLAEGTAALKVALLAEQSASMNEVMRL